MKKKILFVVVLLSTTLCFKNAPSGDVNNSILLSNVEALSDENNEPTKCSRIVLSCSCYKGYNYMRQRIIKCENYEWQPPMIKQYCQVTQCQYESSCK